MSRVWVVGSINADVVLRVEHLPSPGETTAGELDRGLGGKGANQATAAARAGAEVAFGGAVGDDDAGAAARAALAADGIDVEHVTQVPGPTGSAYVMVERSGENAIVVVAGANAAVDSTALAALPISAGDVVVVQGELPAEVTLAAVDAARDRDAVVVWNPAPVDPTVADHLERVDVVVVNETELAQLVGDLPVDDGVARLHALGARSVVATLGAAGAVAWHDDELVEVPARAVDVLDTTGAGDCFVGVLAARLAAGDGLVDAITTAVVAAALAVGRPGASAAMPTAAEIRAAEAGG